LRREAIEADRSGGGSSRDFGGAVGDLSGGVRNGGTTLVYHFTGDLSSGLGEQRARRNYEQSGDRI